MFLIRDFVLSIATAGVLLSGCQSTRVASFAPAAASYHAPQPQPAAEVAEPSQLELVATTLAGPVLLPSPAQLAVSKQEPQQQLRRAVPVVSAAIIQQSFPDTSVVKRQPVPTADEIREADTSTTIVNVLGVVFFLLGLVAVITALVTPFGGYVAVALLRLGVVGLAIGIPFMAFASKNSRRGLLREKRKAERRQAKAN